MSKSRFRRLAYVRGKMAAPTGSRRRGAYFPRRLMIEMTLSTLRVAIPRRSGTGSFRACVGGGHVVDRGMMNEELRPIYLADQAERGEEHLEPGIAGRDEVRRHRVQELLSAGEVHTAEDFFHAAMVFQHGRDVEDYRLAGELAATRTPRQAAHPQAHRWRRHATIGAVPTYRNR